MRPIQIYSPALPKAPEPGACGRCRAASSPAKSGEQHGQNMMTFSDLASVPRDPLAPFTDRLRLAVAAYLARFKGSPRAHTESDLRCYLAWCAERGLDPLAAQRPHLELYIRWMQEIRRFQPSIVSRRFSVTAGVLQDLRADGALEHSPAEHVRRPAVPPESPTLGFTTCSSRPCSPPPASHRTRVTSPWWRCSGCSACGSSKPPALTSATSAKNTATGSCACAAKGPRSSWSRFRPPSAGPSTGQPTAECAGRTCSTAAAPGWTGTRPPAACTTSPKPPASRSPGHTELLGAGDWSAYGNGVPSRSRTGRRAVSCRRPRSQAPWPARPGPGQAHGSPSTSPLASVRHASDLLLNTATVLFAGNVNVGLTRGTVVFYVACAAHTKVRRSARSRWLYPCGIA
jgi:hypothetical protein